MFGEQTFAQLRTDLTSYRWAKPTHAHGVCYGPHLKRVTHSLQSPAVCYRSSRDVRMVWWISNVDGMTIWPALATSVGISGWVR